jgi:Tfp pilus assembly pilus retraction ATPase PilT
MREGADTIVVGSVTSAESARAVVAAVAGGHLVIASITTTIAAQAADRLVDLLPSEQRDLGRATVENGLLGTISPVVKGAGRSFEVVARRDG